MQHFQTRFGWVVVLLTTLGGSANAQTVATATAPERVEVQGNYLNAVGSSDAASQGTVTSKLIEARPTLRTARATAT
jgi:hypothetical protein